MKELVENLIDIILEELRKSPLDNTIAQPYVENRNHDYERWVCKNCIISNNLKAEYNKSYILRRCSICNIVLITSAPVYKSKLFTKFVEDCKEDNISDSDKMFLFRNILSDFYFSSYIYEYQDLYCLFSYIIETCNINIPLELIF